MNRRRTVYLLAAAAVLLVAYSVAGTAPGDGPAGVTPAVAPAAPELGVEEGRQLLRELSLVPRPAPGVPRYAREAFGPAWADVDGNGCNQRDDVLLRDAVPGSTVVQRQGPCPHDVVGGRWIDPYTGAELTFDDLKQPTQAQALQIDHVVPLAEAWRSGAHGWRSERLARFANDLDVLLATDGPTNAAKGSDDPAAWRPRQAHQCAYALRWIRVKHRWDLAADDSEVAALTEMLDSCPG